MKCRQISSAKIYIRKFQFYKVQSRIKDIRNIFTESMISWGPNKLFGIDDLNLPNYIESPFIFLNL